MRQMPAVLVMKSHRRRKLGKMLKKRKTKPSFGCAAGSPLSPRPTILYLSTRGRLSWRERAHSRYPGSATHTCPLVLPNGCWGRPASPGGCHIGQGALLPSTTAGSQEEPALCGLPQLLPVLPILPLVLQHYGRSRVRTCPHCENRQPGSTRPLLNDAALDVL